jgi:hypothetical protein
VSELFKNTEKYISILKRLSELSELRRQFTPPHVSRKIDFAVYRKKHPEFDKIFREQKALFKQRRFLNPEYYDKKKMAQKQYQRKIKDKLFEILGGKTCIICGFSDERALQFDHINGGGIQDWIKHTRHTDRMRAYYIKNPDEARKTLQILCANCNWIKKHTNNENSYQY